MLSQIGLEVNAPLGDAVPFNTNFEAGFSKLYICNAVSTTKNLGIISIDIYTE